MYHQKQLLGIYILRLKYVEKVIMYILNFYHKISEC